MLHMTWTITNADKDNTYLKLTLLMMGVGKDTPNDITQKITPKLAMTGANTDTPNDTDNDAETGSDRRQHRHSQ